MQYKDSVILKFATYIIFLLFLNGCVQGIAFLGPAFSYTQSGNVMQSALSYGSNQAFKKMRDKSSIEKNSNAFDDYGTEDKNYSFLSVKNKIENESNIKNLFNQ